MNASRRVLGAVAAAALAACAANPPISLEGADLELRPEYAAEHFDLVRGNRVAWGGVIVNSSNLAEHTRIEVLGYPLDGHSARPDTGQAAQGRFVITKPGYLETVDFAPGKSISVTGTLAELEQGTVGDAPYTFPVVAADELHVWRPGSSYDRGFFTIGVGIVIHN